MAQDQHKNLSTGDLHECKGAAAAALGTYPRSDGAGSTVWTNPLTAVKNSNLIYLSGQFADISTAESIFLPTPIAGKVTKVYVALKNAITVANSVVTAKIGGVAVTGLSITITQVGSAAGSVFSGTPSALNVLTAGQAFEVITDGGATTTCIAYVTLEIDVT